MNQETPKFSSGFKKQAFGAVLVLFGTVNTVLNIMTDIAADTFDLVMIAAGCAFFAFGAFHKNKGRPPAGQRG